METERASPRYSDIDLWEPGEILHALVESQMAAVAAVRAELAAIERAALAIETRLHGVGRLVYVGAGTSGRLAVQDGAELIPTFNWPSDRLLLLMAGGKDALLRATEGAEDETGAAKRVMQEHDIGAADAVIAVAASGTTPFTLTCMREAKRRGGKPHCHRPPSDSWIDRAATPRSILARHRLISSLRALAVRAQTCSI